MRFQAIILLGLTLGYSCVPVSSSTDTSSKKQLLFQDQNYVDYTGIVQLGSISGNTKGTPNPVTTLKGSKGLAVRFDLLQEEYQYLNAKIYHCNKDWSKSALSDLEFLNEFNEFPINTYEFSQNMGIPYVQYHFTLPKTKLSGNYVLVIYDERPANLILSRRFLVVDDRTAIVPEVKMSNGIAQRQTNHQIEFTITYQGLNILSPSRDLHVVILQNHFWDNAIEGLEPTYMRIDQNYLEYRHFNMENNFLALNEFRFFDIRSLNFRGQRIDRVGPGPGGIQAFVTPDKSKAILAYSEEFEEDLNGGFYLQNRDPQSSDIQSEYVKVNFNLKTEQLKGDVHVVGRYNNWERTDNNKLYYNLELEAYKGSILLKQGFYNYAYLNNDPEFNPWYLEGNHFQTANEYEILLYYREPGRVYDELVGYKFFLNRN
ncbi:MAG: DUF5103 domain-containing protein [Cyclobacteriaceae bacterium]|nr:DUF5103 domain-containing protein [Cyclobacteriaceae bacterium HetDA_MAG_MS6]